jgi:hypothetical protein
MKKVLLTTLILIAANIVFAKKVKFSVDMDTITVNVTGVHVMGDFQAVAGFPGGDWLPNTTPLTQEATSTIYSIIVDIPAFTKYEYKFVNGDQSYEAEFVPIPSRVLYNFNDNRWLWVDSLANDTTDIGAIIFAGNAPANLTLLRFKVDMSEEASIDPAGVHVAGDFQGWDPSKIMLYSFGSGVYEIIAYLSTGTYEFKYYNGNSIGTTETVPLACAVNGNRQVMLNTDTILHDALEHAVCFSGCSACASVGINDVASGNGINIYPNPATNQFTIYDVRFTILKVELFNSLGKLVLSQQQNDQQQTINVSSLNPGIYFVRVSDSGDAHVTTSKLVIE